MLLSHISSTMPLVVDSNQPPVNNSLFGYLTARVETQPYNNKALYYGVFNNNMSDFSFYKEIIPENSGYSYVSGWIHMNKKLFIIMDTGNSYIYDIESDTLSIFNFPSVIEGRNIYKAYSHKGIYFNGDYYFIGMSINPTDQNGPLPTIIKMTEGGVFSIEFTSLLYPMYYLRNIFIKDNKLHAVGAYAGIAVKEDSGWVVNTSYSGFYGSLTNAECINNKFVFSSSNKYCLVGDSIDDLEIVDFFPNEIPVGDFRNCVYFKGNYYISGSYGHLFKTPDFVTFENIGKTILFPNTLPVSEVLVHDNKLIVLESGIIYHSSDDGIIFNKIQTPGLINNKAIYVSGNPASI